jgi:hypothetical protein
VIAGQFGRQQDIVEDGAPLEQDRRLEDHADFGDGPRHMAAVHRHGAAGGGPEPRDNPQQQH